MPESEPERPAMEPDHGAHEPWGSAEGVYGDSAQWSVRAPEPGTVPYDAVPGGAIGPLPRRRRTGLWVVVIVLAVLAFSGAIISFIVTSFWSNLGSGGEFGLGGVGQSRSGGQDSGDGQGSGGKPVAPAADPTVDIEFGAYTGEVEEGRESVSGSELAATIRNTSDAVYEYTIVVQATAADGSPIRSDTLYVDPLHPGQWTEARLFTDVAARDVEAMHSATFAVLDIEFRDTMPQAEIDRVLSDDVTLEISPVETYIDVFGKLDMRVPVRATSRMASTTKFWFTIQAVTPEGHVLGSRTFITDDLAPGQSATAELFNPFWDDRIEEMSAATLQVTDIWVIDRG